MIDLDSYDEKKKRECKQSEEVSEFARAIDTQMAAMDLANDTEFYTTIVFPSRAHRDEFLRDAGWDFGPDHPDSLGNKFIDGIELAERIGVNITLPIKTTKLRRAQPRLAKLT